MRKLIQTMPHPTRVDSLAWKLKNFYESCTALEHIVFPEQKLIRFIDQMGKVALRSSSSCSSATATQSPQDKRRLYYIPLLPPWLLSIIQKAPIKNNSCTLLIIAGIDTDCIECFSYFVCLYLFFFFLFFLFISSFYFFFIHFPFFSSSSFFLSLSLSLFLSFPPSLCHWIVSC